MKHPSNFKSRKSWEDSIWREILQKINRLKSPEKINEFLSALLTPYEKELILRRITAISLIKRGETYRRIGEILWLSPRTISSIKSNLEKDKNFEGRRKFDEKNKRRSKSGKRDKQERPK